MRVHPDNGKLGDWFHVATVYFETDSADLDAGDGEVLQAVAQAYGPELRAGAEGLLLLDGFADHRGEEGLNEGLSLRRAQAVAGALRSLFPSLQSWFRPGTARKPITVATSLAIAAWTSWPRSSPTTPIANVKRSGRASRH